MGIAKVIKEKAFFKRYQVKWRRRREGKTDYYARKRLICQDKNKYMTPKYRFVVRTSNSKIVCQVTKALLVGDQILCQATSDELVRYGLPSFTTKTGKKQGVMRTNYAAAYATGLLCSRRLLSNLGLADDYAGVTEVDGELSLTEESGERRPFEANLDVGLVRTTTGNRVFSALKGASDGGMLIPHNDKRFVGYDEEGGEANPEEMRKHIFGGHVSEYMELLQKEDPEKFKSQFSNLTKAGVTPDNMEGTWEKIHAGIRSDPSTAKKSSGKKDGKRRRATKISNAQRKENAVNKIQDLMSKYEKDE